MWALKQEKSNDSGNENQQRLGYLLDGEQQRQRHCGNERGRQVNHSPLAENEGRTSDGSDGRGSDSMHKSLYLLVQAFVHGVTAAAVGAITKACTCWFWAKRR